MARKFLYVVAALVLLTVAGAFAFNAFPNVFMRMALVPGEDVAALSPQANAQKALDCAYRDVLAAFDRFVRESGDRPIILAGHSQGALHLSRLLRERIAGTPLARRIVAAYVVGWPVSRLADLPRMG